MGPACRSRGSVRRGRPWKDHPTRKFCLCISGPKESPKNPGFRKYSGVIEERIRPPHERDAVDLAVGFDKRKVPEFGGELPVGRQLRKIEGRGEAGARNGGGDVAGGRDYVVIRSAAAAQFCDEFVAGAHKGRNDFTVMAFFERAYEGIVGITFPYQQA